MPKPSKIKNVNVLDIHLSLKKDNVLVISTPEFGVGSPMSVAPLYACFSNVPHPGQIWDSFKWSVLLGLVFFLYSLRVKDQTKSGPPKFILNLYFHIGGKWKRLQFSPTSWGIGFASIKKTRHKCSLNQWTELNKQVHLPQCLLSIVSLIPQCGPQWRACRTLSFWFVSPPHCSESPGAGWTELGVGALSPPMEAAHWLLPSLVARSTFSGCNSHHRKCISRSNCLGNLRKLKGQLGNG